VYRTRRRMHWTSIALGEGSYRATRAQNRPRRGLLPRARAHREGRRSRSVGLDSPARLPRAAVTARTRTLLYSPKSLSMSGLDNMPLIARRVECDRGQGRRLDGFNPATWGHPRTTAMKRQAGGCYAAGLSCTRPSHWHVSHPLADWAPAARQTGGAQRPPARDRPRFPSAVSPAACANEAGDHPLRLLHCEGIDAAGRRSDTC
jgi:hypothetical protein